MDKALIRRYHEQVIKRADNECWDWQGHKDRHGYGWASTSVNGRGMTERAHRLSYYLAYGPIPVGADVMHLCHNPSCSNPAHLKAGTRAENMSTSFLAGRLQRKIPLEAMPSIRTQRKNGISLQKIADQYDCTKQAVRHMLNAHPEL